MKAIGKKILLAAILTLAATQWNQVFAAGLQIISLDGAWQFAPAGSDHWLPAKVPGSVHTDLLAAGKIPNPFYRENEQQVQWVGETNWNYRRTFEVSASELNHDRVLLRCEGLDTLATVYVNGHRLGRTDNMFRTWEFDVKSVLQAGTNTIEISFESVLPYMKSHNAERTLYEWAGSHEPRGRAWVRKEPCNFGWDWGPVLITCGIWKNIELVTYDEARLKDVAILEDLSDKAQAKLTVKVSAQTTRSSDLKAIIHVTQASEHIAESTVQLVDGKATANLTVNHPQLWWPNGMGKHPLYTVRVDLVDAKHTLLDSREERIGLRTIKLLPPDKTHSLRFAVNGVTFFAKGANWIPCDPFPNRVTAAKLRRYVAGAASANMNMLRFWGGGYYENDALFDACDEMGILVWEDCKFACSSYPAFDTNFLNNVRQEIDDNVRRLRHHPSIAVWCGNNEISLMTGPKWTTNTMARSDYDKLFSGLIGGEIKKLAPQAVYVPGSPEVGDVHYWQVWHGGKPFEAYRTLNGFMSEFGFQSFPEPETVDAYTDAKDRTSLFTPVMEWHQRSAGHGNQMIYDMTRRYFQPPKDFNNALWLSQILQGYGIKMGTEWWRQNMPRSMGCIFWQYDDIWPGVSWSSVDYYGHWKALQYMARRFYEPVLVSGRVNTTNQSIAVYVTSDLLHSRHGKLSWQVTDLVGKSLKKGSESRDVEAQASRIVKHLDLARLTKKHGATNLLVWLKISVPGQTVSKNLVTLVYPKELNLRNPELTTAIRQVGDAFHVKLTAKAPALWSWLTLKDADASYSDNFNHVRPGSPIEITVKPKHFMTLTEFKNKLQVHSLYDTYKHP